MSDRVLGELAAFRATDGADESKNLRFSSNYKLPLQNTINSFSKRLK